MKIKFISTLLIALVLTSCSQTLKEKSFDNLSDFIGTVWISRIGGSSIFFQDDHTIIYHVLVNASSSYSPNSFYRKASNYQFNSSLKAFAVNKLDAVPQVSLLYILDKTNTSFIQTANGDEVWKLETKEEIISNLK